MGILHQQRPSSPAYRQVVTPSDWSLFHAVQERLELPCHPASSTEAHSRSVAGSLGTGQCYAGLNRPVGSNPTLSVEAQGCDVSKVSSPAAGLSRSLGEKHPGQPATRGRRANDEVAIERAVDEGDRRTLNSPRRCPTCGSDNPAIRNDVWSQYPGAPYEVLEGMVPCWDSFHRDMGVP